MSAVLMLTTIIIIIIRNMLYNTLLPPPEPFSPLSTAHPIIIIGQRFSMKNERGPVADSMGWGWWLF
jgi:hypothetical protein